MTLRPSTAPQHVPLPSPPASSLPASPNPASDSLRAASPAVTRFLATTVTDPLFESTAASALVTELVDFAAPCRLDYAASIVTESASVSVCPPFVGGECALGTDVLEDTQEEFECFFASVPHLVSMLLAPEGDPNARHLVLQRFGFTYSSPQSTPLPTGHSLSAPPSDKSVELSGPYPEMVGCRMFLKTCTRPDLAYPLSLLASYVAPDRHRKRSSQGYTFSLGSGSVSWRSTRSSSVLRSSCEAEIYAGAMAAQELRWLTYLLTDLGEAPRSPPVLYVDNKAMLALCQEHRLEHRTKHIVPRFFLARELQ
ncbi:unnamed protein product [Closterium sp. NIES-53]